MVQPEKPLFLSLIGGHLSLAPRPQKEALVAERLGFRVELRGVWWDQALAEEDLALAESMGVRMRPVVDLRKSSLRENMIKLKQRGAKELFRRLGIVSPRVFGIGGPELLSEALSLRPSLAMVHSEAGLWVAEKLIRKGIRVGVDFEDWFSQDLLESEQIFRPISALSELECSLLKSANVTLTTTESLAKALSDEAGRARSPIAIPNCFPFAEAPNMDQNPIDSREGDSVSLYWFSQTIGPGRGLENLALAIQGLTGNWELHLRGNLRNYSSWFEQHFPASVRSRITLHSTVRNSELASHTASHDVGLALEIPFCRSRDLTATNKIFEYLRCGLAIVATATTGQQEVMKRCPDAGTVVSPDDVSSLASALQRLIDDRALLKLQKEAARSAAQDVWAWEKFEPKLGDALMSAANCQVQ